MSSRGAAVVALVALALAACTAAPAGAGRVEPTTSTASPTAEAEPSPAPTRTAVPSSTPTPTPEATPKPTPKPSPTPTPVPVPPKPTGLSFDYCCGLGGDGRSAVSWAKPRAKGVEIRVYGVTKCFPADDGADESCIRAHTALPADIRVLLAKAPASKGSVSWVQDEGESGDCAYEFLSENGTTFFSVVVAAYNASGRSTFAIADAGYYSEEDRDCTPID